jgi:hypothetical protein
MAHLQAFGMMALEYGRLMVVGRGMSGEERTVRAAYRAMLRREPDASELAEAAAQLRDGSGMLHSLWIRSCIVWSSR